MRVWRLESSSVAHEHARVEQRPMLERPWHCGPLHWGLGLGDSSLNPVEPPMVLTYLVVLSCLRVDDGCPLIDASYGRRYIYVQRHYTTSPNAHRPHKQTTLSTSKSPERSCGSTGTSKPKCLPSGKLSQLALLHRIPSCPALPPFPTPSRHK